VNKKIIHMSSVVYPKYPKPYNLGIRMLSENVFFFFRKSTSQECTQIPILIASFPYLNTQLQSFK